MPNNRVKIFAKVGSEVLEEAVNEWIETQADTVEILHIKFRTRPGYILYGALENESFAATYAAFIHYKTAS